MYIDIHYCSARIRADQDNAAQEDSAEKPKEKYI